MSRLQFLSLSDAQRQLDLWRCDYGAVRPHSALGARRQRCGRPVRPQKLVSAAFFRPPTASLRR